jgi:uncharacterized integral membrane protein
MTEEEQQLPADETGGLRRSHQRRLWVAAIVAVVVLVYIILLIAENAHRVKVHYVFGTSHTRLIWLIIVVGLLGWFWGIATTSIIRRRSRRRR